jgi:2-keto-3-deoxy-L-rhamnonate aldolase
MAGVLTNSVDEVLEWLGDSQKAGAQWGLVLAPGYFGLAANQENLKEWYTLVADLSPIPILMYALQIWERKYNMLIIMNQIQLPRSDE